MPFHQAAYRRIRHSSEHFSEEIVAALSNDKLVLIEHIAEWGCGYSEENEGFIPKRWRMPH